ncbi:hypothetical protein [Pseudomonas sp. ACN8]|uniref:hypothetical protein n=1 Tax=Pseudomonas sp. ACN8 TaxID=1920428 RepID=UPI0011413D4F|nr:hypothetical protein [Pseudomonas sp. ACN8]
MTSFNQATLDALKAEATANYKNRIDGYDAYATTCPKTLRAIPGWVVGADVMATVVYQSELIPTYIDYAAKGYVYKDTIPMVGSSAQILLTKPEKPVDLDGAEVRVQGVQYQSDDIVKIHGEVEAKYRGECEAKDIAATQAEKDRIYAEALAEVEVEEQAALADKAAARAAQIQARIAEKVTVKPATKRTAK